MKKISLFATIFVSFFAFGMMNVEAISPADIEYPGSNVTSENRDGIYYLTLTGDADEDLIVSAGETVVLDLNGFTLKNYTDGCEAIKVLEGGSITIVDNSVEKTGTVTHKETSTYGPITNYGTMIIESGNYTTPLNFYVVRNEGENLTIKGGNFTTASTTTSLIGNIKYNELSADLPTMTITGGSFTAGSNAIRNNANTKVNITGGEFTSEKAFALDNSGTAVVTGGTLTSIENSAIRQQINGTEDSSLKITNATLNSAEDKTDYTIYDIAKGEDVTADYNVETDSEGNLIVEELTPVTDITDTNTPAEEVSNEENPETSDGIVLFLGLTVVGFAGVALTYRRLHN